MGLKNPRADSLPLIRDFIKSIEAGVVGRISDFSKVVPNWKRTRCYHYWSAIRDLKLAQIDHQTITLTPMGKCIARVANFNKFQTPAKLNPEEIKMFKLALLGYEPIRRFLSYFISVPKVFEDYGDLKRYGDMVTVEPDPESKKGIVLLTAAKTRISLSLSESYTVRWSFKLWCKDLGIIDEMWLDDNTLHSKYAEIHHLPKRAFFPIKLDIETVGLREFQKMLDIIIKRIGPRLILIPLLTFCFCRTHFVAVKGFHSMLCNLYRSDPYHYYLETGGIVGVNESYRKIRDYEIYPRVDGYPRNYLLVRK